MPVHNENDKATEITPKDKNSSVRGVKEKLKPHTYKHNNNFNVFNSGKRQEINFDDEDVDSVDV